MTRAPARPRRAGPGAGRGARRVLRAARGRDDRPGLLAGRRRSTRAASLEVLARPRVHRVLWFTVWSAVAGTAISVLLGLPAAYVLHRLDLPGRRVVRAALLVPFVLPTVVVGVAFRQLLRGGRAARLPRPRPDRGRHRRRPGVLQRGRGDPRGRCRLGVARPAARRRPRPRSARRPWQVFRTVTLPALRPAIVSAASVVFLFCATAFGIVLTLGGVRYATVETEIYLLTTTCSTCRPRPPCRSCSWWSWSGCWRSRSGCGPSRTRASSARGPPAAPARAAATCRRSLMTVLLLGLRRGPDPHPRRRVAARRTARGAWRTTARSAPAAEQQALLVPVTDALLTSLRTAVDATWMSLSMGLLVALIVTRRSRSRAERRLRGGLDGFFMLPLGVSAVTLGFGFLITLDQPPLDLRDSPAAGADRPGAGGAARWWCARSSRCWPASTTGSGRRPRRSARRRCAPLLTVDLPVVWKPLLAASGFAFAVSLGEFGATSFLARDDAPDAAGRDLPAARSPRRAQLRHGPGRARSCSPRPRPLVMLAVERLRVPSVGAF